MPATARIDINEKSAAWVFGEKRAGSRWRQIENLQRIIQGTPKPFGASARPAMLMSAKAQLGLPPTLPKLTAEMANLPWRSTTPELKDAVRSGRLSTLYRGTTTVDPFWSTNAAPVAADGTFAHKTYVHGSALPSAAASYGATFPGGPGGAAGSFASLVSRHKPTGAEKFTPDWGQSMFAADVGNTWPEILSGMRNKLPTRDSAQLPNGVSAPIGPRPLSFRLPELYKARSTPQKGRGSVFSSPAYETKLRAERNPHQGYSFVSSPTPFHNGAGDMIADVPNTPKWQQILRSTLRNDTYNPARDNDAFREFDARSRLTGVDRVRDAVDSKYFLTPTTRLLRQLLPPMNRQRIPVLDWLRERAAETLAQRLKFSSARAFGEKLALDLRLPSDYTAARQLAIASAIGAGIGAGRGFLDPGYSEVYDAKGRVIAKKRRNAVLAALKNGLIGGGTGALGSYAAQLAHNYTPEIDAAATKTQQLMDQLRGRTSA